MAEIYDNYCIFSPEGKIRNLTYVENSVNLGNISVGLLGKECGIIIGYMGERSELEYLTPKVYKITNNSVFSFSGITNDGLELINYLLHKCVEEDVIKDRECDPMYIFEDYGYEAAKKTVYNSERLMGVGGMYLSNYKNKIYLVEISPTGIQKSVHATSIGQRSQSAKTILQRTVKEMRAMDYKELIQVGVHAIKNTNVKEIDENNLDVWKVDKNGVMKIEKEEIKEIIK